jgi:hypothetical protein
MNRVALEMIEVLEHNERLMGAVVLAEPAIGGRRLEEFRHETVRITLAFQNACALEFRDAFQLIARESPQKFKNKVSMRRNCTSKKSTDQRRARGDDGQVKLRGYG